LTNQFSHVWLVFSVKCQSREFLNTILLELPLCTHLYATNEGDVITGCLALLLTTDTVHFTLVVKRWYWMEQYIHCLYKYNRCTIWKPCWNSTYDLGHTLTL